MSKLPRPSHRSCCSSRSRVRAARGLRLRRRVADSTSAETVSLDDCTPDQLETLEGRHADDRDRQAGLPALLRGQRPDQRQGLRERRRLRDRRAARLQRGPGRVGRSSPSTPPTRPVPRTSTSTSTRSRSPRSAPSRSTSPRRTTRPIRRSWRSRIPIADGRELADRPRGRRHRRPDRHDQPRRRHRVDRAELRAAGVRHLQRRRLGARERPGRRDRGRHADRPLPDRGRDRRRQDHR